MIGSLFFHWVKPLVSGKSVGKNVLQEILEKCEQQLAMADEWLAPEALTVGRYGVSLWVNDGKPLWGKMI